MSKYEPLLPFCSTDRQREIVTTLINSKSQRIAANTLNIGSRSLERTLSTLRNKAQRRGDLGELKEKGHVPDGFYAETSVKRRLDPATNEMVVVEDWTKSKREKGMDAESYISLIEGFASEIKPTKPLKTLPKNPSTELATAIIFGDPHIGMLAHAIETLGEDYDMDKGIADIKMAIDYCVDCAPASEEGWFVNVGDLTHSNDSSHQTPGHGNVMDMSHRHNQTMRAAGAVIRYCIAKMLTKFKTVKVVNARGNHDKDAAFAVNFFLEAVYENEPRVHVFGNDSKFNFLEFGANLIMVNHGDGINDHRLAGMMTRVAAEAWGRTKYHRAWTGHIHHKTRKEHDSGVVIESFPILPPVDEWHAGSGYGAERGITSITLHREYGEVNRMEPSIEMLRAFATGDVALN